MCFVPLSFRRPVSWETLQVGPVGRYGRNGPTSPRTNTAPPGASASPASSTASTAQPWRAVSQSTRTLPGHGDGERGQRGAEQDRGRLLVVGGDELAPRPRA